MSSGLRDMDMFWLKKRDHCCATDVCICFQGSLRRRILRYNGGSFLEASVFKTDQLISLPDSACGMLENTDDSITTSQC